MANRVQLEAILKFVDVQVNPGVFAKISRGAAGMPGPVAQFNKNLTQSVGAANNVSRSVRGVNSQLTASERAARLFLQRMAQFAILLPTFATLNKSIQGGVKFLFEFDSAIKDIIRVDVGKLGNKFDDIAEAAFKLSDAFGSSALVAVNTIKTYVQAGFDFVQAQEMARLSILATKASTLDAAGATEFLLAANKQFRLEGEALTRSLDSLVAAEDLSALEAQDIADAFRTGGNSLAEFAKDINDSIGLISALREQTRKSGNEIGTFFKTLQTRIFAAGESRAAIEALGISIQDMEGNLRPTLEVLNDLKTAFDGMSEAQKANAAKAIAGVRQFESLIGTLNSLKRANQLSVASSNSAGAALRKEEVDATKLSRRLDELVVAGEKLAYALGEAGSTDFFKGTLQTVTAVVNSLTELVKLLDAIKIPVLPILAPLALKAVGGVFGLNGGSGGSGGQPGTGGGSGGGGVGGGGLQAANSASITQNTAAMRNLAAVVSQLAQQMLVVSKATMTQSQLMQTNIALENLRSRAISAHTAATTQGTQQFIGTSRLWNAQTVANTSVVGRATQAIGGLGTAAMTSINSIQSNGAKFAVQYALLTVGVSALTSSLNFMSEKMGGNSTFAGSLTQTTSAGVQLAGQFAILGPQAAAIAGLFGAAADAFPKFMEAAEDHAKALGELRTGSDKTERMKPAGKVLAGDLQGLDFLQTIGKTIKGRTGAQLDFNKSFNEAFKNLSPATKAFIKNAEELKDVLFDPARSKETISALAQLDSAAYTNQEALQRIRDSLDETGKSSMSSRDLLNTWLQALGKVDVEIDAVTGMMKNLVYTFKEMKELQQLIGFAQSVSNLGRNLKDASASPEEFAQGIDKMRLEAQYAAQDMADAQASFEALRKSLVTQGATEAELNPGEAQAFIGQLNDLLLQANSGSLIADFLGRATAEERKFAEEYLRIEEDRRNSVIKSVEAKSSLENEIYKRSTENIKAQKEAASAAADALAKFQVELSKLGATSSDTSLMSDITKLSSSDVANVLAGTSDLPNAIQDVINSTFVDGVKKAEISLSRISDETANAIRPIEERIAGIRLELEKLGEVQPNTEKSAKKDGLQNELAVSLLQKQTAEQEGYTKSLEGLRTLTTETKKAQEDAARAEADRLKKTQALTDATYDFSKSMKEVNKNFADFVKQRIEDLAQKQAGAYEAVKTAQQGVLSATEDLSNTYRDYISTIIQVNGAIAESKIRANLLGRDIGVLNGNIVTFQDKLNGLTTSFRSVLDDANMSLEQRIQLESQLAEQTLQFLEQAQDQIVNAGLGVFGQSASENQGLQKGIAGLSYVAEKLGGSFQNFLSMDSDELGGLSQELLNLPVEFRKSILDALSFLPSTTSIGGFSADQLKQAIGQIGAGVSPEAGLPAISELTAQQVEQLKILGQLGQEEAKLQLSQVLSAQKQLEKAQEQLDVAKLQEERAREGFDEVTAIVAEEMALIEEANIERRDLLQRVIEADNANTLNDIAVQSQLFADQNTHFSTVGTAIVTGVAQAINARVAMFEAQTSLNNFNSAQSFEGNYKGFIPNFANGNLSPGEAAGLLRAASREKRMMPNGAKLAVANDHEAIIPMYKNFAGGNEGGSAIASSINSIRSMDQTMVAAIATSITNSLSQISGEGGDADSLGKIASLLTELNTSIGQVRDSNLAIKTNTAGLSTQGTSKSPGAAAIAGQEVKILLQTNQNNTVQITGIENLRDQLKLALSEATSQQAAQQLEALMVQLDPLFQALNERGIISSFGQPR